MKALALALVLLLGACATAPDFGVKEPRVGVVCNNQEGAKEVHEGLQEGGAVVATFPAIGCIMAQGGQAPQEGHMDFPVTDWAQDFEEDWMAVFEVPTGLDVFADGSYYILVWMLDVTPGT